MKENLLIRCRGQKNYNMGFPFPILLFRKLYGFPKGPGSKVCRAMTLTGCCIVIRLERKQKGKQEMGNANVWVSYLFPFSWQRRVTPCFTMPHCVSPCLIMPFLATLFCIFQEIMRLSYWASFCS